MTGKDLVKMIQDLKLEDWEVDFEMNNVISLNNPDHIWGEAKIGAIHSIDISPYGSRFYVFKGIHEDGDAIYDWVTIEEVQNEQRKTGDSAIVCGGSE